MNNESNYGIKIDPPNLIVDGRAIPLSQIKLVSIYRSRNPKRALAILLLGILVASGILFLHAISLPEGLPERKAEMLATLVIMIGIGGVFLAWYYSWGG